MRLHGGKVFDPALGFVERDVCFDGEVILETADGSVDVSGCYVIPGLTDLHFHGCCGADFSDGDAEGLQKIADYELSCGVTQICPAGMTLVTEQLEAICRMGAEHRKNSTHGAELVGIHLEGPFLSYAKKGAQNGTWLQNPNIGLLEHLVDCSEGLVKLVSIAPELDGAMEFIQAVSDRVVVSVAHTTAGYEISKAAFDAGARHATHLFNAMPTFGHREPGVIGAAFDSKHVYCEIISDGVHIHPAVIRSTFEMIGKERMILVSDTMRAAGMPDGDYTLGGLDVKVVGNKATLSDGTLAGSVSDLMSCMKKAVSFGIPIEDAVMAASVNPAKALGMYDRYGSLDIGKMANIVVLDHALHIMAVIQRGKIVHGAL